MFQTILNPDDVFRTDLYNEKNENTEDEEKFQHDFSTNPADYLSRDGFYL